MEKVKCMDTYLPLQAVLLIIILHVVMGDVFPAKHYVTGMTTAAIKATNSIVVVRDHITKD